MIEIPEEFRNLVFKTKSLSYNDASELKKLVNAEFNHVTLDYLYETVGSGLKIKVNMHLMMVFETTEDAIAFKLKHGNKYV